MVLRLLKCCAGGDKYELKNQSPVKKRAATLPQCDVQNTTIVSSPSPSGVQVSLSNLPALVQEFLLRLPQIGGSTWLQRLQSSVSLLAGLTEVDAASVAIIVPLEGDNALPYVGTVGVGGPRGTTLQQYQQLGYQAALAANARNADEAITSAQLFCPDQPDGVVLMSADSSNRTSTSYHPKGAGGGNSSTHSNGVSNVKPLNSGNANGDGGGCGGVGPDADLPVDWACCAAATSLRHFCGLPIRVGTQLLAVITLAWSAQCPVPPRLRTVAAGAGAAAAQEVCGSGGSIRPPLRWPVSTAPPPVPSLPPTAPCGSTGRNKSTPGAPSADERACLLQLAQIFSLGLFGDADNVVYGQKVARMLNLMARSVTLQGLLDSIMAGIRDVLSHRCQLDLAATLAVAHPSAPAAAFIVESRNTGSLAPLAPSAPAVLQTRQVLHSNSPAPQHPQSHTHHYNHALSTPSNLTSAPDGVAGSSGKFLRRSGSGQNRPAVAGAAAGGGGTPQTHSAYRPAANANTAHPGSNVNPRAASPPRASAAGMPPSSWGASQATTQRPITTNSTSALFRRGRSGAGAGGNASGSMFRTAVSIELGCGASIEADAEPATPVQAHVTSLAHTLLLSCLAMVSDSEQPGGGDGDAAGAAAVGSCGADSTLSTACNGSSREVKNVPLGRQSEREREVVVSVRREALPLAASATRGGGGVGHRLIVQAACGGRGGQASTAASGAATAGVTACGCVVPNCHLHMQDEALPCRDVVLVQKLARTTVQSLAMVLVRPHEAGGMYGAMPSFAATMPSLAIYLTSGDPLGRPVLVTVQKEARYTVRLAMGLLCNRVANESLVDEWSGMLDALSATSGTGRVSISSTRVVSLLRPRSYTALNHQMSGDFLLSATLISSPTRGQVHGVLSMELTKPLGPAASSRMVVDNAVDQPLQQLDAMVSSVQSTLSAVQLQLEMPGCGPAGGEMQEIRLVNIAAVELMEVIGRGGQGLVFRGTVHGIEAAVKVISHRDEQEQPGGGNAKGFRRAATALDSPLPVDDVRMRERKRSLLRDALELAVTGTISHPNIVQMYNYFTDCVVVQYSNQPNHLKLLPADSEALQPYGSQRGPVNTVMCMEYCDAGTLKSAAEAGAFRQAGVSVKNGPACPALVPLYTSLLEVALALRHLHGRRLVHCDLKPSNVLLKSSLRDLRGWTCKLSDFGCVRVMNEEGEEGRVGFRQPLPLGTLTHMAPEMFVRGGLLDGSVDIYAFGIIMWELIMVAPLFDGTVPKDKLPSLVRRGLRPNFHPLVPPEYRMLATACWLDDPRRRPTAAVLVTQLQRLLARAQAASSSASTVQPAAAVVAKSSSTSLSGMAQSHMASSLPGGGFTPSESDVGAAGAAPPRHAYGAPRRNTVVTSVGTGANSAAGAGLSSSGAAGQRPAFLPVSSPLSREAGPAARAAVRIGDGGGAKPMRLPDSSSQAHSAGGALALSPLGMGLGHAGAGAATGTVRLSVSSGGAPAAAAAAPGAGVNPTAAAAWPQARPGRSAGAPTAAAGAAAAAVAATSQLAAAGPCAVEPLQAALPAGPRMTPSTGPTAETASGPGIAASQDEGSAAVSVVGGVASGGVEGLPGNVFTTGSVGLLSDCTGHATNAGTAGASP